MLLVLGKKPICISSEIEKNSLNWRFRVCTKLSKMTQLYFCSLMVA